MELWVTIDGSNSIGGDAFDFDYIPAIIAFLNRLDASATSVRAGYVLYSSRVRNVVNPSSDIAMVTQSLSNEEYPDNGTSTHLALQRVREWFDTSSTTRQRVVIVITDGQSQSRNLTQQEGDTLKNTLNTTVIVVGIGNLVDTVEINRLASPGMAIQTADFTSLSDRLASLTGSCSKFPRYVHLIY